VPVLWLNDDGFQAADVWQILQSVENLAAICPGLVVALKLSWWQLTHAVDVPIYPLEWQLTQVTPMCPPVKGKVVFVLWLNVAGFHAVDEWHVLQSVEILAATCPGFVVPL
jgi:hypothetical protein